MSKILVVCDQGINRSVTVASLLRFVGHDALSAGLQTNSATTLLMLGDWADKIILTDNLQQALPDWNPEKLLRWPIGPDIYPRPYNKQLYRLTKQLIDSRGHEL